MEVEVEVERWALLVSGHGLRYGVRRPHVSDLPL